MANEPKFRHEYKHEISYGDCIILRQRLRAVARLDPHVGENGKYYIRSVYFDNINDKALREKIDGVNEREKFRIRFYNGDLEKISLEKKCKINSLCLKISAPLNKEQCEAILNGDIEWMRESKEGLIVELYSKMKYQLMCPKTIVDYTREPYVYNAGNVRITIDSNIRSGLYNNNFLNLNVPTVEAADGGTILEIKYDEYLPDVIRDVVQLQSRSQSAFSKYAVCRRFG